MEDIKLTTFNNDLPIDNSIFKMFDPKGNDLFSDMSKRELKDFLLLLDSYVIDYRDKLNIEDCSTFSPEMECVDVNFEKVKEKLDTSKYCLGHWNWSYEEMLLRKPKYEEIDGKKYELTSREFTPIVLSNSTWDVLYEMCNILNKYSSLSDRCGLHINYGIQILGDNKKSFLNLFDFVCGFEDIMFGYGVGEFDKIRGLASCYARPVSVMWSNKLKDLSEDDSFEKIINDIKICKTDSISLFKVNKNHIGEFFVDNVFEYRFHNPSTNPIIIQNNVNADVHAMMYAKSDDFNLDLVDNYKEELVDITRNFNNRELMHYYTSIKIDKFLKFIDLIYSDGCNLDKINTCKQYFKSIDFMKNKNIIKKI